MHPLPTEATPMDNPNNDFYTMIIPGDPLTTNSTASELTRARESLSEQIQGMEGIFPIAADIPVELRVSFNYLQEYAENEWPGMMDAMDIALEITLGILYHDNCQIHAKSVMKGTAEEGAREGSTEIKICLLP